MLVEAWEGGYEEFLRYTGEEALTDRVEEYDVVVYYDDEEDKFYYQIWRGSSDVTSILADDDYIELDWDAWLSLEYTSGAKL